MDFPRAMDPVGSLGACFRSFSTRFPLASAWADLESGARLSHEANIKDMWEIMGKACENMFEVYVEILVIMRFGI